ncbi:hypothetical protein ACSTS3_14500 [Aquimarina muelleri]|uniref:hypothetical protein n=1 Tax=Aquimarina muelleri TaxID=279356 RepID=UPI003F685B8B
MRAKSFLMKILFLFLAITLSNCTTDNFDEDIEDQNFSKYIDKYLIDKEEDIQEPDDRK